MTDAYSLALLLEAFVVATSGLVITYVAATRSNVVLYSRALVLAGSGLVVAGGAIGLLAFDATELSSGLVVLAAIPYGLAGWRIATDAVSLDGDDVYLQGRQESTTRGFKEDA